jgi:low temperature requirement protein LtrA
MILSRPLQLRSREGHEPGRKVTWLELFFDLVFVAAVAQISAPLVTDYSLAGLGRAAFLFLLIWWAWHGHTTYATRFDTDDVVHRGLTLLQMFAAIVMAINAQAALDSRDSAGLAAAYAVMRFVLVAQYWRARSVPESRTFTTRMATGIGIAALLWFVSALAPVPARFWFWGVALLIDLATPIATARYLLHAPPDAAHLPERFGLFTIILIGEALVGLMHGMQSQETWSLDGALSAFSGIVVIFAIWWWYFDGARAAQDRVVHSTSDAARQLRWTYAHVPLYLGIVVWSVGVHHLISMAAIGHLHPAESWMLCGAFTLTMAALTLIADAGPIERPGAERRRELRRHGVLITATLALGAVGPFVPVSAVMVALAAMFAIQCRPGRARHT